MTDEDILTPIPADVSPKTKITPIDFSSGNTELANAFQKQYPQLNNSEVSTLGNIVLTEVGRRIGEGQPMAFLSTDDHGKPVLSFLRLEIEGTSSISKLLSSSTEK